MSATDSIPPVNRREAPWMAGLRAARANALPGLIVQALMFAVLMAYYFYPPMRSWLDGLAGVRARWGYGYALVNSIVAGALIPELLRISFFQRWEFRRNNLANLCFTAPFYGFMGLAVDLFYRQQAIWFGEAVTVAVVTKKVLVDQFLYNPLFACPVMNWLYDWKARGYRFHGTSVFFTAGYYREFVVPTLFATWGVWIPVMVILYSLPTLLQIPLFGLALSLWVMLYTWMTEQRKP
ncbi:MAG: hypothetical protein ACRCXD_00780 [Luteolibacter sp.]